MHGVDQEVIGMLMHTDMLQQVDHLLRSTYNGGARSVMAMDTYRRGDEFVAEIDLPGVDRDSIDVTVEGNVLQITAQRRTRFDDVDQVGVRERAHGVMTRQLFLSQGLDRANIAASYDDGVLRLVIPLSEDAKPRTIQVTAGATGQTAVGAGDAGHDRTAVGAAA
jgi:HSP20 family protein